MVTSQIHRPFKSWDKITTIRWRSDSDLILMRSTQSLTTLCSYKQRIRSALAMYEQTLEQLFAQHLSVDTLATRTVCRCTSLLTWCWLVKWSCCVLSWMSISEKEHRHQLNLQWNALEFSVCKVTKLRCVNSQIKAMYVPNFQFISFE